MRKVLLALLGLLASSLWASQELWVIYHTGCSRCDAFLNEVVTTYPDAALMGRPVFLPIKLLSASLPLHQELITKIDPPVYSTPTFLRVEKQSESAKIKVLDRWVGYKNKDLFYQKLNEVVSISPQA